MPYPVILKKDNKPLKAFKTIKEMAEFIKWDYFLLCYYIRKDKRTDDGFTFKVDWKVVREQQKDLSKKLNIHYRCWNASKKIQTARFNADEYMYYANEILSDLEAYKNTIRKLKPIPTTMPYFNYLKECCKIAEYNEKLVYLKEQMRCVRGSSLVVINNKHNRFKDTLNYITQEHLSQYVAIENNQIVFQEDDIAKIPTLTLNEEDRLSILCLKSLMEKLKAKSIFNRNVPYKELSAEIKK